MKTYSVPSKKAFQFTPSKPIGEYPEESVKKIAVLFTDIVGSSKFFKSYGDATGRKMLRQHQEIASPAVLEHGGIVVKVLGDSIMAYFSNPLEALKSAIKIQQKFRDYNQGKELREQIHIRICVHFGDGIVEEKDIFGDVVNMAAKFLPLAGGDQIFISDELYRHASGLSLLNFESVDLSSKKNIFKGLTLYKVFWEQAAVFDPYVKTLLYLKPVWELDKSHFANAWDSLIDNKDSLWGGRVEKESIFSDKSIALILKDPRSSLPLSRDVMQFLHSKLEKDGLPFLPLQAIIDSGPYVRADKLILEDLNVDWEEIKPGNIYISFSAYKDIGNGETFSIFPKPDEKHPQSFYKLNLNDQPQNEPCLFLYQNVLAQGKFPPCYYCGDRKHLAVNCPSKQLTQITQCIKKLGYLPLEEINKLFFNYLTKTNMTIEDGVGSLNTSDPAAQWAHHCFCELKMVFQLRFLRELWNTREDCWNKVRENKNEGAKGGPIWLGQDCIRVSKLDQAEAILSNALAKHPGDYRVHCAMGFLKVEEKDFSQAKHYFSRALENAETRPQKIFAHFLLSRLFYLNYDLATAEDRIMKILHLDPNCSEAIYQGIILQFRRQKNTEALKSLIRLIRTEREYYVFALIDPELADFNEIIHPELSNLFNEARDEAKQICEEAEEKAKKLDAQLTAEEKAVNDPKSLWSRIEELSKTDSYFSYMDIIHFGSSIINTGSRYLEERRKKLLKVLNELRPRIENCFMLIDNFHHRNLIANVSRTLNILQTKMNNYWDIFRGADPEKIKDAFMQAKELTQELEQVELELEKLKTIQQVLSFFTIFIKKTSIYQSVNLIVAFLLFPIFVHYLNFFLPEVRITPQNIWEYQKMVLFFGGFSGLCLAVMVATKNTPKE
uniref:Guanylate cyclase domain-containing protein n=1 Tax=Candidatus Desulfatibia profunda TaxID=2841695 RepID=A0A8J6NY78_9BACT|nr:hypothetical protein [Candidatus Desulfatibia profunda]